MHLSEHTPILAPLATRVCVHGNPKVVERDFGQTAANGLDAETLRGFLEGGSRRD